METITLGTVLDNRTMAAVCGDDGRWRIWLMGPDGITPEQDRTPHKRGYTTLDSARRAWRRHYT